MSHPTQRIYSLCKRAFAALPLAAHIAERTLVLHGGLFRKPRARARLSKPKRKRVLGQGCMLTTTGAIRASGGVRGVCHGVAHAARLEHQHPACP